MARRQLRQLLLLGLLLAAQVQGGHGALLGLAQEFLDALDGAHERGFGGDIDDFGDRGAGVGGCDGGVWDGAFLDAGVWFGLVALPIKGPEEIVCKIKEREN